MWWNHAMSLWSPPPPDAPRRLADLRVNYDSGTLAPDDLTDNPHASFLQWFEEAEQVGLPEPNAMILATASVTGQPSSRTVLLKEFDARGLVFYTNLGSRKGAELAANPAASCVFPWFAMHRQVVVHGSAELLDRSEVDDYFRTRPRGSQIGAWASQQSTVIDGRDALEERHAQLMQQFGEDDPIPTPDFWGGWLIRPETVEFWQGRPSRLHDRLRFVRISDGSTDDPAAWRLERLSP
jgi:pyridoxamine 5'-phosphate oxidase